MPLPDATFTPIKGAPAPYYITCPQCGSPDALCDASAQWDYERQEWVIAGTQDEKTCQTCGYEKHSFDATTEAELTDAQRAFIFDGADYQKPEETA